MKLCSYEKRIKHNRIGIMVLISLMIVMSILNASINVWAVDLTAGATGGTIDIDDILTAEEIALMQEQEIYTVGYISDFQPLSYVDNNGDVSGAGMDVWSAVADILDIEFELVEATSENIEDESVDVYLTRFAPDGIVMEQRSDAYYTLAYVYIHNSLNLGMDELPVGILSYFELTDVDIEGWLNSTEVITYNSFEDMNAAFLNGEIQSMVLTSARFNTVKEDIKVDYTVDILKGTYDCCLSYGNGFSEEKIEIINKVIEKLDGTAINYSILEHSTYEDSTLFSLIQSNQEEMIQIVLVIIIILTMIGLVLFLIAEQTRKNTLDKKLKVDTLTSLGTLTYYEEEVVKVLKDNPDKHYTIFSFDIDNFKYINEIYGHETGNKVLYNLGKLLIPKIPHFTVVARISGDQFIALIETKYVTDSFIKILESEYLPSFSKMDHGLGKDFRFSFSAGYYHIVDRTMDISHMINCSRMGKEVGKGIAGSTIYEFTPQMSIERSNNNHIVATMNSSVENKEFVIFYQPKVDLVTNRIVGAEALVRWVHDGNIMPPVKFIPIFEKNGFIETLDSYVLSEVCRFIKENEDKKFPVISVNLSAVTVLTDDLVSRISDIVKSYDLEPTQLEIEITESALVDQFDKSIYKIQTLRNLGFTIAIDDFGVGISSLSQLKKVPIDILKIDRGFVIDALTDEKGAAIVSHIVLMAKDLHLETIAEGIETRAQEEFFRNIGCNMGQGYYYSRPINENNFLKMLEKDSEKN